MKVPSGKASKPSRKLVAKGKAAKKGMSIKKGDKSMRGNI